MKLNVFRTADNVSSYPLHTHRHCEMIVYLEGNGVLKTPKKEIPFGPHTMVLIPPGVLHGSCAEPMFKNISVEGDFDRYFCARDVLVGQDNAECDGARLAEMLYGNRHNEGGYTEALCHALVQFMLRRFYIPGVMEQCVGKIVDAISRSAFDPKLRVNEILLQSGYSEDYVRAAFKQIIGKTPIEFLNDIRIKQAVSLIDIYQSKLSLSDIAARCGYFDYSYFSKLFRKAVGVSPLQYRHILQGKQ